jgi:ABC-type multidrug transport system fused ATPase/permease subunit
VELVRGKTALLISHRLGSARLAHRVVVLDGGRVAETGSHAELMAAGGLYAELFKTQAQWYEEPAVEEAVHA